MMISIKPIHGRIFIPLLIAGALAGLAWSGGCDRPRSRGAGGVPVVQFAGTRRDGSGQAAEFRLARDTELGRQQEVLTQLIESAKADESVRAEAEKALWRLAAAETAEHQAEALLAAAGWRTVSVAVLGDEALVMVYGRKLASAEAAEIGRLVAKAAGLDEAGVRIEEQP